MGGQPGALQQLPSVERLASELDDHPHAIRVAAARAEIAISRERIAAGETPRDHSALRLAAEARAERLAAGTLRPVINATGVVLHTNLGRAPLAEAVVDHVAAIARGYSNLEYDLESGERSSRLSHIETLLRELAGADAAIAVNNNAAAVTLAVAAVASGREVIVSRGQLIEIGGSFRIPEILEQSGAHLLEVGTANRTRLTDYEIAIGPQTAAILRVHQSNFRTVGFTEEVPLADLGALTRQRGISLIDDLGSGALGRIEDEPTLPESLESGSDLVCASADKLLGGPQAGIIAGQTEAVDSCRRHPLARAFRLDKLQLAALEATLRLHQTADRTALPVRRMLEVSEEELDERARTMAGLVGDSASVSRAAGRPGGGTLPLLELEGPVCVVDPGPATADQLAGTLRQADPPVVVRINRQRVVLDPRTMSDEEAEVAATSVLSAFNSPAHGRP